MNTMTKFSVLALLIIVVAARAEIDGSGFHGDGCTGAVTTTFWIDSEQSGIAFGIGNPLANVEIELMMSGAPELGADQFATNDQGVVEFTNLCSGLYTVSVDASSLPSNVRFSGVSDVNSGSSGWGNILKLVPIEVFVSSQSRSSTNSHRELRYMFEQTHCGIDLDAQCDMIGTSVGLIGTVIH